MQEKYLKQIATSLKLITYVLIISAIFYENGKINEIGILFIILGVPILVFINAFEK